MTCVIYLYLVIEELVYDLFSDVVIEHVCIFLVFQLIRNSFELMVRIE